MTQHNHINLSRNSSPIIFVSFGENCLTDNIIARYKIKSFSTPFSHARSNIECILQLEKDNYKDLLNLKYLVYISVNSKMVPLLTKYNLIKNHYNPSHENGLEFTHHDVIGCERTRSQIDSRLQLIKNFKGMRKFVIIYHHRMNAMTNFDDLLRDLYALKVIYSTSDITSEVVCFTQNIVNIVSDRKLVYSKINDIHCFTFQTLNEWAGDNPDVFWAKCDDDLVSDMIDRIKCL